MQNQNSGWHHAVEINQGIFESPASNSITGIKSEQPFAENFQNDKLKENRQIHPSDIFLKHFWVHNFETDSLH